MPDQQNPEEPDERESEEQERQRKEELNERIHELANNGDPEARLKGLSKLAHDELARKGKYSLNEIETWCSDFGSHEVVGTGMCAMSVSQVLEQLSQFTKRFDILSIPQHGGNQDAVDAISGNNMDFQHNAYYALQTFYSKAIFALVVKQMELYNNEVVSSEDILDNPVSKEVFNQIYIKDDEHGTLVN